MENTIEAIISLEWDFFDQVQNIGGRADCQDDFRTFFIMRKSQFLCWSEAMLESYYQGLIDYRAEGGNPVSLKYAYMMKYTSPQEYYAIADRLPAIPDSSEVLIDRITAIQTAWSEQFYASYPRLKARARPLHAAEDSADTVSSETYLRCELYTYSPRTLNLYYDYICSLEAKGKNIVEMILQCTFHFYGYASLEEAEASV